MRAAYGLNCLVEVDTRLVAIDQTFTHCDLRATQKAHEKETALGVRKTLVERATQADNHTTLMERRKTK